MISLGPEAGRQYDELVGHYEALGRSEAMQAALGKLDTIATGVDALRSRP